MTPLLMTVFTASLVGSLHCVGMCGGLVTFYAGSDASVGLRRFASHVAYNGGRLFTYVVLGAAAGAFGSVIDLAGSRAGYARVAGIVAGTLMIVWGGYALAQALGAKLPRVPAPAFVTRAASKVYGELRGKPPAIRALALGLFSTFLPCGWLYAFAIVAAGTGHSYAGMAVMAAFWLGTLPWMAALGISVQVVAGPIRRHVPVLMALVLVVVGVLSVMDRSAIPFERAATVGSAKAISITDPAAASGEEGSCCKKH
ncbi:MAG: sulfite exporter TauE/SafE family protein [Deltaproteobacteria bacterium]|nr:sulfite exporter TauE/SafE family protein [Deltaproteobacteria bacterium]